MPEQWVRPESELIARTVMLTAEEKHDYETAALAALAMADYVGARTAEGAASLERQALVYASLHQTQTALFIAENRMPMMWEPR